MLESRGELDQGDEKRFGGRVDPMDILDHDQLQPGGPVRLEDALDNRRAQGIELMDRGVVVAEMKLVAVLGDKRQHDPGSEMSGR